MSRGSEATSPTKKGRNLVQGFGIENLLNIITFNYADCLCAHCSFVAICFVVEVVSHGLPEQKYVEAGDWLEHLSQFKENIKVKSFIYSHFYEPWVWVGLKAISGIR